jgi:nitrogen fixation protein FixH
MTRHPPSIRSKAVTGERELTGRHVLIALVAFFGLVILVNVAMVRAAISTFGGLDTPSSYEAGLEFKAEEARAAAQTARDWTVTASLIPSGVERVLSVDVRDARGSAVSAISVNARLMHPVDERHDLAIALREIAPGSFRGGAAVPAGLWRLELTVVRDGVRLFRSENRVMVK